MTLDETKLFQLLDDYSRRHHQCFLAEFFLDGSKTNYILCFRSSTGSIDSANRYACRYLHFAAANLPAVAGAGILSPEIRQELDQELPPLAEE